MRRNNKIYIALAAGALALVGCQREELAEPGVLSGKEGVVKFAPSVGGIVSGVKSSSSEDASSATYTQTLTLTSEDGKHTLPMNLSVTSLETGDGTKATLINENGEITDADFATAIGNTFWVATWNDATTPAQIIPDATAKAFTGGYVSTNKEYQKVMYRDGVSGTHYWMTVQPQTATVEGAPEHADDEYIWKDGERKTFYAYANVPSSAMTLIEDAGGQTMTCTDIPTQDILMGYYSDNGGGTGTASIKFHHPLAAVKVKTGTLASGVTISSVAIENVYGSGDLMVKQVADEFTWTGKDGAEFTDDNLVTLGITCDGDAVFVIPQTFPSKARIRVTLEQGGKDFNVYYILSGSWEPGTLYTYTIGYNPPSEDLLPGKFSISATEYVQFSRGNLFCTRSGSKESYTYTFNFEHNQYDYRTRSGKPAVMNGVYSENGTATDESGLFQFDVTMPADYGAFTTQAPISGAPTDIIDFGQAMGTDWHTINASDIQYIIDRSQAYSFAKATVVGVKGILLFPDNWTPTDVTIIYPNKTNVGYDYNVIVSSDMGKLEATGVVFLPMAGYMGNDSNQQLDYNGASGFYRNSDSKNNNTAFLYGFSDSAFRSDFYKAKHWCVPVRLVQKGNWPEVTPKFVDLGLPSGTLWADVNIGATAATGQRSYGKYYAWGETAAYLEPMTGYGSWAGAKNANYEEGVVKQHAKDAYWKWTFPSGSTSKYKSGDLMLPEDDIATQKYGEGCHIPTIAQWEELFNSDYTIWTWDADNNGYIVESKSNPNEYNRIFIPNASFYKDQTLDSNGQGRYWTNEYSGKNGWTNVYINANSSKSGSSLQDLGYALTVRAVKEPAEPHDAVKIGNLYWATENLAVTESGRREYNNTGHVNGDYFQWAASYDGYKLTGADRKPENLVLYSSFTSTMFGDAKDEIFLRGGLTFYKNSAPFYDKANDKYTKYNASKTIELADDIASLCWGGSWRIPTDEEFRDMIEATYWEWDDEDKGYYVYNPKSTNDPAETYNKSEALLFFPAAGRGGKDKDYPKTFYNVGVYGWYWSNKHNISSSGTAFRLNFSSKNIEVDYLNRYYGFSVRPVHD